MLRRVVLTMFLFAFLLPVVFAGSAVGQLDMVDTSLEIGTNPFLAAGNLWKGDRVYGFVTVALCYEPGGLNPDGGGFLIGLEPTTEPPAWVQLGLREETHSITAPFGPVLQAACTEPVEFQVQLDVVGEIVWNSTFAIDFAVTVEPDGARGTYATPDGNTTRLAIEVGPDPRGDELGFLTRPPEPAPEPAEERGAPAPGVLAFVALAVAFDVFRRGRWLRARHQKRLK